MSTLIVGTGQQYATLTAAVAASQNGDTIEVEAGTYTNDFPQTITDNITIEGIGGMATFVATEAPPNLKAILVTQANVTIDNLAFTGVAIPSADGNNGAGIRYQGGNLVLNDDYFYNNQEGLLAAASPTGTITINNSEFADNGAGDGFTHNLYVGQIATLTINDSLFTGAVVGHEIKSRADTTIIENSRIIDGATGTASYSIDLPNGGNAIIENNVIEQGPLSQNPAIIHFGGDSPLYAGSSLTIENNTIVNDLNASDASLLLNQTSIPVAITGNAIYGLTSSQIASGPSTQSGNSFLTTEPTLDLTPPWETGSSLSPEAQAIIAALPPLPQPNLSGLTVTAATGSGQTLTATSADALLIGGYAGDKLNGGAGFSVLYAGAGNETLTGGSGTTDFVGGSGSDQIQTGTGPNYIAVGTGHETIALKTATSGNIDVYGFNAALDTFAIHIANATNITAASLVAGVTSDAAGDAVIHYGSNEMVLHAVPAAHVSADWFTIVH